MRLPPQSPPVRRPDLVQPHRTVDVVHGTPAQLLAVRISLMHGANYNDPQAYVPPMSRGGTSTGSGWSP